MAQDAQELVVAGTGDLHIAPYGTTLPALDSAPRASLAGAFSTLGFITEDGATISTDMTVEDFMAWQSRTPIRRELTQLDFQISAELEQWNEHSVPLAFGGGSVTETAPGIYRYDFVANDEQLDEFSAVLDWADGDKLYRMVLARCNNTEGNEIALQRGALATLPVVLKALEDVPFWITNDPAFELSS